MADVKSILGVTGTSVVSFEKDDATGMAWLQAGTLKKKDGRPVLECVHVDAMGQAFTTDGTRVHVLNAAPNVLGSGTMRVNNNKALPTTAGKLIPVEQTDWNFPDTKAIIKDAEDEPKRMIFAINRDVLASVLKNMPARDYGDGPEVVFEIASHDKPIIVRGEGAKAIIMPMVLPKDVRPRAEAIKKNGVDR